MSSLWGLFRTSASENATLLGDYRDNTTTSSNEQPSGNLLTALFGSAATTAAESSSTRHDNAQACPHREANDSSAVIVDIPSKPESSNELSDADDVAHTDSYPSSPTSQSPTPSHHSGPSKASKGQGDFVPEDPPTLSLGSSSKSQSNSSSVGLTCLICLESLDLDEIEGGDVAKLGCQCTGQASYRHKKCVLEWIRHKGNTTCEVCKCEMTGIVLPPPPNWAIFVDCEPTLRAQMSGFMSLMVNDGTQYFGAALIFCIIFDTPLKAELLFAVAVVLFITLRCIFMVVINTLLRRRAFFVVPPVDA